MKINKNLLIMFMVLISLFAISAVSASDSDNATDIMELSDIDEEMETIEVNDNQDITDALSAGENNTNDIQINIAVENATYDEPVSINITVADNTGTVNFTESTVEIQVDGKFIANAPISPTGQSEYTLAIGDCEVGIHDVKATLINGTNRIATNVTLFSVTKATPVVNVENITVKVYETVTIPVNVTDKRGKGITGGAIVTIFWQGDSLSKYVNVVDGSAYVTFDFKDIIGIMSSMSMADMMSGMMGGSGGMNWADMFSGNGTSSMNWADMFSGNGSSSMNWADMFGGNGSSNMWEDMFSGNGSGNMMEGMVSVSFEYIFVPGKYNVTTTFLTNRNYNTANATSDLIITYLEDVVYAADITVPKNLGDNATAKITVMDKYGNPIPNVAVNAVLDDKQEYNVTLNENGTAQITFNNLVNGDHRLVLKSNANGSLTSQSFDFVVQLIKANVTITANDITVSTVNVNVDGKTGKYFTATLKDSLGNAMAGKTVFISINNQKFAVTTDQNGAAKVQLNIAKAGTYTCTIAFLTDDVYNGAFEIAKVTVNKQAAKLTVAKKSYKASAKTKKVTATFKSAKGKAIKNKKITFKVKGKTYTAKTNGKGVATVKVKLTKKGTYKVTAKFAGDDTYKAVSKTGKLILK